MVQGHLDIFEIIGNVNTQSPPERRGGGFTYGDILISSENDNNADPRTCEVREGGLTYGSSFSSSGIGGTYISNNHNKNTKLLP